MYMDFLLFILCPLGVTRYTDMFGSVFFTPPDLIIDIDKTPANFFFSRLSICSSQLSPTDLILSSLQLCPTLDSLQYFHVSSVGPSAGASIPDAFHPFFLEKRDQLPPPAGNASVSSQAAKPLLHRHIAGPCTHWCPPGTPGSFLQSYFSAGCQCRRLFPHSYRTLHFPQFYFMRFLTDHFYSLPKSLY